MMALLLPQYMAVDLRLWSEDNAATVPVGHLLRSDEETMNSQQMSEMEMDWVQSQDQVQSKEAFQSHVSSTWQGCWASHSRAQEMHSLV